MLLIACGLAISIATFAPRSVKAQFFDSYEWNGGDGLWSTPSKWTPSGPPDFFEVAVFNHGGVVTVPDGTEVVQFLIGNVSTTFDGGGISHHMSVDDFFFNNISVIGQLSTEHGVLTLQNGTFDITFLALTQAAMSQGDLIIRPTATLNSTSVGVAISPQSQGNLTVDGGRPRSLARFWSPRTAPVRSQCKTAALSTVERAMMINYRRTNSELRLPQLLGSIHAGTLPR